MLSAVVDWVGKVQRGNRSLHGSSIPWAQPPLVCVPEARTVHRNRGTQDARNFRCQ